MPPASNATTGRPQRMASRPTAPNGSGQSDGAQLEIRASWTPADIDVTSHVQGWSDLVCQLAGLPPTADAVSLLPDLRASRD